MTSPLRVSRRIARDLRAVEEAQRRDARASQAGQRSVEDGGSIPIYDADGVLRTIIGATPDDPDTFTVQDFNGPAPAVPSDAIVEPGPGSITVTWDGFDQDEEQSWTADWRRVEVHVDADPDAIPTDANQLASFGSPAGGAVTLLMPDDGTYYVVLTAVNSSGAESAGSNPVEAVAGAYVTPAQITQTTRSFDPPGDTPNNVGDVWYQTDPLVPGRVIGWWVGIGGTDWEEQVITGVMLAVDALDGRVVTGATLQTAAAGQRVVIYDEGDGGVIELWSGLVGETPGVIDPKTYSTGSTLTIRPGTTPANPNAPEFLLVARPAGAGYAILDTGYLRLGDLAKAYVELQDDGNILLVADGEVRVTGLGADPGVLVTGDVYVREQQTGAGNGFQEVRIGEGGRIVKVASPSTIRLKHQVEALDDAAIEAVLNLEPVTYQLKPDVFGPNGTNDPTTYVGFIAEQACEVGAEAWVGFDADGEVATFRYAELTAGLVGVARAARAREVAQDARIEALEALVAQLLAREGDGGT